MIRLWVFFSLSFLGFTACGDLDLTAVPKTAIRQFKDKADSAEVETLSSIEHATSMLADRIEPRRTPIEIYIFKNPEFDTYYKKGEGRRLAILLLVIDGELTNAAYTSTGDVTKVATKTYYEDGVKKTKRVRGSNTSVGTYSVDYISINKTSDSYGDATMFYSVFFNGGIAMHETGHPNYGSLGQVASMGCARLNTVTAKAVFNAVKANADINSKGKVYGYSKVTINVAESGALKLFSEVEILRALEKNFRDEAALRRSAKR